ncbi:unnamed protein product [Ectocarpus sp. 8 AP-2014]
MPFVRMALLRLVHFCTWCFYPLGSGVANRTKVPCESAKIDGGDGGWLQRKRAGSVLRGAFVFPPELLPLCRKCCHQVRLSVIAITSMEPSFWWRLVFCVPLAFVSFFTPVFFCCWSGGRGGERIYNPRKWRWFPFVEIYFHDFAFSGAVVTDAVFETVKVAARLCGIGLLTSGLNVEMVSVKYVVSATRAGRPPTGRSCMNEAAVNHKEGVVVGACFKREPYMVFCSCVGGAVVGVGRRREKSTHELCLL